MQQIITSGEIISLIIVIMAFEMLFLLVIKHRTGRGPKIGEYLPHQLAGLFMLLSLRSALVGQSWPFIASGLLGSFICHLVFLKTLMKDRSKVVFPKGRFSEQKTFQENQINKNLKTNFNKIGI